MDMCANYSLMSNIFLISNFSRKHGILHFFSPWCLATPLFSVAITCDIETCHSKCEKGWYEAAESFTTLLVNKDNNIVAVSFHLYWTP